ncbi:DNA methylase, partial [Escherichia coli]|nr:DNA methylase [Escherichia coli]
MSEIAVKFVDVDSLVPYARNARTHSPEQIDQIARSIQEFGWT